LLASSRWTMIFPDFLLTTSYHNPILVAQGLPVDMVDCSRRAKPRGEHPMTILNSHMNYICKATIVWTFKA